MLRRKNTGFYQYGDRSASHSDRNAILVLDCVYRHRADCAGLVHNYQVLNGGVGMRIYCVKPPRLVRGFIKLFVK